MEVRRCAPTRTRVSSSMGVFGAFSAWLLVRVGEVVAERRSRPVWWGVLASVVVDVWCSGLPPRVEHDVMLGVVVIGGLEASLLLWVPVVVMPTQPLPGVPVGVLEAQPLPGARGVRRHHHRQSVCLQFPVVLVERSPRASRWWGPRGGVCCCCFPVCWGFGFGR